jgi:hypothetical protein
MGGLSYTHISIISTNQCLYHKSLLISKLILIKEVLMVDKKGHGLASMRLSGERENEILSRCFAMVDYLNDMATEILMEFMDNASCPIAKQLLLNSPEVLAVKAFEKAIIDLNRGIGKPDATIN